MRQVQDSANLGGRYGDSFFVNPSGRLYIEPEDQVVTYELELVDNPNGPVIVAPTYPELREQAIEPISGSAGGIINLMTFGQEGPGVRESSYGALERGNADSSELRWISDGEPSDHFKVALSRFEEALHDYAEFTLKYNQVAYGSKVHYVPVVSMPPLPQRQGSIVNRRERERLFSRLMYSFEEEPVEDGMYHPAEDIIAEALSSEREQHVLSWLAEFSEDAGRPAFAASLLRCLGRYEHAATESWRIRLVRTGLSIDDVEIRDAAVQASELWGDRGLIDVLEGHHEPEPWLRQYICDVIGDLKG